MMKSWSKTNPTKGNTITVYNGDCMEFMKDLPENAYNLAITDPPYGINICLANMGSRNNIKPDRSKKWDICTPDNIFFDMLMHKSLNQIIWGGNYFNLPPSRCFVVWDKGEKMYGRSFADAELAWTSFNSNVRIIKISPMQVYRIHPTQKPVKLYEWLLTNYAKQGDKILDTHMGSGSIAIACYYLGFDLTAIELDEDYYNKAIERIDNETSKQQLF